MATDDDLCPQCGLADCDCSPEIMLEAERRRAAGEPPLVIASDAAQVGKRVKAVQREERKGADDMNWLMRHPQGRRMMWGLLEDCGIYHNPAFAAGFDTNQTMFKAGQQNIGQYYLKQIVGGEPDAYLLMVKENSGRTTT